MVHLIYYLRNAIDSKMWPKVVTHSLVEMTMNVCPDRAVHTVAVAMESDVVVHVRP